MRGVKVVNVVLVNNTGNFIVRRILRSCACVDNDAFKRVLNALGLIESSKSHFFNEIVPNL
jgi:hypothetical protein